MHGLGHNGKLIRYYCVHFTKSEEKPASELVLVVDLEPVLEHAEYGGLQDPGDGKLRQPLLLKDLVVLLGLGRRTKVRSIGCSVAHLGEKVAGILRTHLTHVEVVDRVLHGVALLELLLTLLLIDSLHESEALLVLFTDSGRPPEQL